MDERTQIIVALIGAAATVAAAAITVNAVRNRDSSDAVPFKAVDYPEENTANIDADNASNISTSTTETTPSTAPENASLAMDPPPPIDVQRPVRYWNDCTRTARLWLVHYGPNGWDDNGRTYWEVEPHKDGPLIRNTGAPVMSVSPEIYLYALDPNDNYAWQGEYDKAGWGKMRKYQMEVDEAGKYLIRLNCTSDPAAAVN